jgi:endonuclease/exonuclease/phosphatase (EEP) superfamily protein YafD
LKLRLVTANLWNGGADPTALAELLESLRPDLLAVQELSDAQADAISSVLPHGVLEPRDDHTGMGIALRESAEIRRLPLPGRDGRVALLQPAAWTGLTGPVEIVNLHIQAPHTLPQWRALALRRGQLAALEQFLDDAPHPARLVCGDFNATPLWPFYRRLASRLDDVAHLHATRLGQRPARTWGPWPGAPRLLRIDHAFARGIEALHVQVVTVPGSDHSALVLDFEG